MEDRKQLPAAKPLPAELDNDATALEQKHASYRGPRNRRAAKQNTLRMLAVIATVLISAGLIKIAQSSLKKTPSQEALASKSNLFTLEQMEARLSPAARQGKEFLAHALLNAEQERQQAQAKALNASPEVAVALSVLAEYLSNGQSDELIGHSIILRNVTPLDSAKESEITRRLKVTKFLGEGAANLVLEIVDEKTNDVFALRIPFALADIPDADSDISEEGEDEIGDTIEKTAEGVSEAIEAEEACILKALGDSPANLVASLKGIAVPLYKAYIDGLSDSGIFTGYMYMAGKVQVMERLHGDLERLLGSLQHVPVEAKLYIAQRLLLEVLNLQDTGISHNDIRLSNCLMRRDGSFLISDLGSSAAFGSSFDLEPGTATGYTAPELILDISGSLLSQQPVTVEPSSDMWTVGALLFELFTDGALAYDLTKAESNFPVMRRRVKDLLANDVSPAVLVPDMERANVPSRWQALLLRLLEPKKEKRITSEEVVAEFADLWK